jgi:leucyl aminopeptidase (aminopeptidase T)
VSPDPETLRRLADLVVAVGANVQPDQLVGVRARGRVNQSDLHYDVVVGGDDVTITGVTAAGKEIALLEGGEWQPGD